MAAGGPRKRDLTSSAKSGRCARNSSTTLLNESIEQLSERSRSFLCNYLPFGPNPRSVLNNKSVNSPMVSESYSEGLVSASREKVM